MAEESMKKYARQTLLDAMYRSVNRMNHHLAEGNLAAAVSEQHLQINLRSNFEEIANEPEASPRQ